MPTNILFILVDGLRADQCFGVDKTSHTPFLDSLISSGTYFKNTFATADGTTISLNCVLILPHTNPISLCHQDLH